MVILDRDQQREILRARKRSGADRFDEIWDGVYVVSTVQDIEHQGVIGNLAFAIRNAIGRDDQDQMYLGVNVSDRVDHWKRNVRIPDLAFYLEGNPARDCSTHWFGGPDFAVEVISPGDRSRQKFTFYAKVGVRELLLVDRYPWSLELYRRQGQDWELAGVSDLDQSAVVTSDVLPLSFRLVHAEPRPLIEVAKADGTQHWQV
jgi:Uma2 family endonuclease